MTNAYQLTNIRYFYGDKLALSLPDLAIASGKITALIGPNGSGKSTLLNLLAFLQPANDGSIAFFGEQVHSRQLPDYRNRIGYLPQKPYMLRGTVQDNLKLALKFRGTAKNLWRQQIDNALELLNIGHLLNQDAKSLSGGELQKSALARVLVTGPEVLLLDEPFSHLDQAGDRLLELFILSYLKETEGTLIFSTHDRLQGLAMADDVISLVQGERVKSPLINLYHGSCTNHIFSTGKIDIMLTADISGYRHVSIDPHEIVLSRQALVSSIRNQFHGRVISISDEMGKVRIAVAAGEIFQVLITYEALNDLSLNLGDPIWVNFKSNSVTAF
jgi:tungstate transport system ATP-binding protein